MEEPIVSQAPVPAPRSAPVPSSLDHTSEIEISKGIASIADIVAQKVIKEATESVNSSSQESSPLNQLQTVQPETEEESIPEIVVTESGPQITSDDEEVVEVKVETEAKIEESETTPMKNSVIIDEPKVENDPFAEECEEDHELAKLSREDFVDEPKLSTPSPKPRVRATKIDEPKVESSDPFADESEEDHESSKLTSKDSVDGPKPATPSPKPRVLAIERKPSKVDENAKSEPPKPAPKPESPAKESETKQNICLNPFGDDEEEPEPLNAVDTTSDSLNPFGDEEEEVNHKSSNDTTADSLNPFGDFEDEVVVVKPVATPTPSPRKTLTSTTPPPPPPRSPRGARGTPQKKRLAPAPPTLVKLCPPSPLLGKGHNSQQQAPDPPCDTSSASSSRTPTPIPRRSKGTNQAESEATPLEPTPTAPPRTPQLKVKKRPAPPIPAFKRSIKSSVAEMDAELERIGDELPVVETNRLQLEHWLLEEQMRQKEASPDEEPTGQEYEDKLQEFIQFSIRRCKLAQKQKEFAYLKREHKLEESQVEVEFNLRQIMSKQDILKTEEDKATEKELLDKLVEIIDERNEIIEAMVKAENLEIEEYIRMIAKVIPEQAKEMRPKPLHVPSTPAIQTPPEVQAKVHKHRSARKLLKNTTASTLSLLKLKKKKKKDKDKDKEKEKNNSKITTDSAVSAQNPAAAELSDSENENSPATSTGANNSLQVSMASSIDQIEAEPVIPTTDTKERSESRASMPNESTKDVSCKKKSTFASLSKSTFKKFSPKPKASDIKTKLSNSKESSALPDSTQTSVAPFEPNQSNETQNENEKSQPEITESPNIDKLNESKEIEAPLSNGSTTPKSAEPEPNIVSQ